MDNEELQRQLRALEKLHFGVEPGPNEFNPYLIMEWLEDYQRVKKVLESMERREQLISTGMSRLCQMSAQHPDSVPGGLVIDWAADTLEKLLNV